MILTTYAIIYLYICYKYHYTRFVSIFIADTFICTYSVFNYLNGKGSNKY